MTIAMNIIFWVLIAWTVLDILSTMAWHNFPMTGTAVLQLTMLLVMWYFPLYSLTAMIIYCLSHLLTIGVFVPLAINSAKTATVREYKARQGVKVTIVCLIQMAMAITVFLL